MSKDNQININNEISDFFVHYEDDKCKLKYLIYFKLDDIGIIESPIFKLEKFKMVDKTDKVEVVERKVPEKSKNNLF